MPVVMMWTILTVVCLNLLNNNLLCFNPTSCAGSPWMWLSIMNHSLQFCGSVRPVVMMWILLTVVCLNLSNNNSSCFNPTSCAGSQGRIDFNINISTFQNIDNGSSCAGSQGRIDFNINISTFQNTDFGSSRHSRGRYTLCRFSYYNNSSSTFQILTSGDIEQNPGPVPASESNSAPKPKKRIPKNPCTSCEKGVIASSKAISCDLCNKWTHSRCTGMTDLQYYCHVQEETNFI